MAAILLGTARFCHSRPGGQRLCSAAGGAPADTSLKRHVSIRGVLADAWRLNRTRFTFLVGAALGVFVPVGFVEALQLHEVQTGDIDVVRLIAIALVAGLFTAITLIGEVLYSGIVAAVVKEDRGRGPRRPVGQVIRSLPYRRLIATDLLLVVTVAVGFIALIVPGVIFLAWFALAAPVVEVERRTVRGAFRRSRALVRRDFWRCLLLVLGVTVASELISTGITSLVAEELGHTLVDRWIEATLSGMLTAPLFAFPIVVLYFELAALDKPAATSSGTVTNR